MNSAEKANLTEKLNREYIMGRLSVGSNPLEGPDFYTDKCFFEMKSKLCRYFGSKPTPNIWWSLSQPQIEDYELFPGTGLYWMFVHAFTDRPSEELNSEKALRESITHRDIFIAPWSIYKRFNLQRKGSAKKGPYRTVSRKNLLDIVGFSSFSLNGGVLYLPKRPNFSYLIKKPLGLTLHS